MTHESFDQSSVQSMNKCTGPVPESWRVEPTTDLKGLCIECKQPFKFGTNVFTKEGLAETRISGMCEQCFDALFEEDDDDDEE